MKKTTNQPHLPNVMFEALAPEKLDAMIEAALALPQEQRRQAARTNVVAFPSPFTRAAWFTGTGAIAAALFLAITLSPMGSGTASASASGDLTDLLLYQTLSQ